VSYENPQVPHEVNVARGNPLLEFLRLAAGIAVIILAISALLYFSASWLARQIPFEWEQRWVGDSVLGISSRAQQHGHPRLEAYLQSLTDRLAARMDLPAGMRPRVHWVEMPEPNAFASLGGQIAVTRGLYQRMENALSLVLAHEIAHLRARDPIAGLGGSAAMLLALTMVTGNAANLSTAFAEVVRRGYSRGAEAAADEAAIAALRGVYGHAAGGASVFEGLALYRKEQHRGQGPSLLSTHPLDEERVSRLREAAEGWNPVTQPLRPLQLHVD
jgi:predicted Zn-dependent protease